jgi:glycine oxidase
MRPVNRVHDTVIIGAGVIGCAVAYELARRGADVLVLDPRGIGQGATQASAGMLAPYHEAHEGGPLRALAVRSLALYDQFVADVQHDGAQAVPYVREGSLEVATADESTERLQAAARDLMASNVECSWLDAGAAHIAEPLLARDVTAGLLIPQHGYLAARDFTSALAKAAMTRGATIESPDEVRRVSATGNQLHVHTTGSTIVTRHVVLAAGCWSGNIAMDGIPRVPVRPVRGQLLHLAWNGPSLRRIVWGTRCYIVPLPDNSILVGATVEEAGFDARVTVAGVRDLLDAACELIPQAWQAGFLGARVGLRPGTPDELPIVGSSRRLPGMVYATGHYRNGVLLAPLTAKLVADLIADGRGDPALEILSPDRFGEAA